MVPRSIMNADEKVSCRSHGRTLCRKEGSYDSSLDIVYIVRMFSVGVSFCM